MGFRERILSFFRRVNDREFNEAVDELVAVGVVERRIGSKGEELQLKDGFLASLQEAIENMKAHYPEDSEEHRQELALVLAIVRKAPKTIEQDRFLLCHNIVVSLLKH